jgi:hypothetical protein
VNDNHVWSVPNTAPGEHKAIAELMNKGANPRELFKAAFTFYNYYLEKQADRIGVPVVRRGLFSGMKLFPQSLASCMLAKQQGTYELEVLAQLEQHGSTATTFLNIGAAEGFYVVGMARWLQIACYGVDINPRSKEAVEQAAALNNVTHLVHWSDSITKSVEATNGNLLCIIDVDGNELEVLVDFQDSINESKTIRSARIIVETDRAADGYHNTSHLLEWMIHNGWKVETIIQQNPSLRFVASESHRSFLEQVVRGAEGRPGGQSWIVATWHLS